MADARHHSARKAAYAWKQTLESWYIPVRMRRQIARTIIYPSWFGCELWGLSGNRTKEGDYLVRTVATWASTIRHRDTPGESDTSLRELRLPPQRVIASRARVRAVDKAQILKSYAKLLVTTAGRGNSWAGITNKWIANSLKNVAAREAIQGGYPPGGELREIYEAKAKLISRHVGSQEWVHYETKHPHDPQSRDAYKDRHGHRTWKYHNRRLAISVQWFHQDWQDSIGRTWLRLLRQGTLRIGHHRDIFPGGVARHENCRFCGRHGIENTVDSFMRHIMFECPKLRRPRQELRDELHNLSRNPGDSTIAPEQIKWLKRYHGTNAFFDKAVLLIGGSEKKDRNLVEGWYLATYIDAEGNRVKVRPICMRVCDFLEKVANVDESY